MDDLDKRRHDWEQEMQRMQEDFFKVVIISDSVSNVPTAFATPFCHGYVHRLIGYKTVIIIVPSLTLTTVLTDKPNMTRN